MKEKQTIEQATKIAISKIEKVMMGWFTEDPVMLGAWCLVDKIPDPKQETIGVNCKSNPPSLRYNPFFVSALNTEQLECVLASEGFKILLRHPTTRLQTPQMVSSLASQITVDQLIMGNLLNVNEYFPMPEKFNLKAGSFYEDYFRKLLEQMPNTEMKIQQMFGQQGDGGKEGEQSAGQGQGEKDGEQKSGSGYKEYDNAKDALKDYFNPNGTANKDWAKNDLFDSEVNQMIDEKKGSAKDWGKYTGDAMGDIVAANTPKISYKDVLRRFNMSVMSTKTLSSRMKINRRYDLDSPGYRRQMKAKIIFAIDASGSMSVEDLAEGFSVLNNTCRHADIEYILFDTEIKLIEKKLKKAKKTFTVTGRGGTSFEDVCKYAEEHKSDGLVIYTDGEASAPTQPKGVKVLWLLSTKEQKPPVEWGFRAVLDRYENH